MQASKNENQAVTVRIVCASDVVAAARASSYRNAASIIITRSDAPVVRNLRRGSASDALASFRASGATALVEEILQDR